MVELVVGLLHKMSKVGPLGSLECHGKVYKGALVPMFRV